MVIGLGAFEPSLEERKKELKELLLKQKKAIKLVDSVSSERGLAIYQSITMNEQRIKAKKAYIKIAELNEKIDKVRNNREYDALMKQREKYKKIVFNFEKGN